MKLARESRFDLLVAAVPLLAATTSLAALPSLGVRVSIDSAVRALAMVAALVALLLVYERRDRRLADALRMTALGIVLSNAYPLPMYALGAIGPPFADRALLRLDHALGIRVDALVRWVRAHPAAHAASDRIYDSLVLFGVVALIAPALARRTEKTRVMLLAIVIASVLSLAVFARVQAFGPWASGAFAPTAAQAETEAQLRALHGLHEGGGLVLDLNVPGGLIALPSWHVILAVITAHALAWNRRVGAITWAWGGLIVLSTLTTGWHYFVDVMAGAAIAALSIAAAERLHAGVTRRAIRGAPSR